MDIKVYKIKDSLTGKFSTGGLSPKWTNRGKTWSQFNHVKAHLRQFISTGRGVTINNVWMYQTGWWNNIPESWIVVELSSEGIKEYSAKELYPGTKE